MIQNYLKIAFRQLKKQQFYSLINISGLAIGIAACLLIFVYIRHELSYDQHHSNANNIYRTVFDVNFNQTEANVLAMPSVLPATLISDFPEVINASRITPYYQFGGSNIITLEGKNEGVYQDGFVYADQAFTEIFDFPVISGDPQHWLEEPNTLIITQKIAERFYGNENPVGKQIKLNNNPDNTFTITGVTANIPKNSHFEFDYFISMPTLAPYENNNWLSNNYFCYVQLAEGTDIEAMNKKLEDFSFKYFATAFKEQMDIDLTKGNSKGEKYQLFLQALKDVHLHSAGFIPQLQPGGDIRYINIFGAIGIFLLLIGSINFINLATARSANRAREVGVRKVLGSARKQLMAQFMAESVLVCFFATLIGLTITYAFLPIFNELANKELSIPVNTPWFIAGLFFCSLLIGGLSGIYPALYLSGFRPIEVLRGRYSKSGQNPLLRKSLVVFQFAISAALIIGTLTVYHQMRYIQNKKMGFDKNRIIRIEDTYALGDKEAVFKKALLNLPEVQNATTSPYLPFDGGFRSSIAFYIEELQSPSDQIPVQYWPIDAEYLNTLGVNIKEGRGFSAERPGDSLSIILNEAAVKEFQVASPVGKRLASSFMDEPFKIIGVVENFHYETLKSKIEPLALYLADPIGTIAVKAKTDNMQSLIAEAEKIWQQMAPGQTFRYTFMDERFDKLYESESRSAYLLNIFTGIAIFIACLGLFGLATFTAEQRTKEIGIRKVLGASVSAIVGLLSKDFLKLVLIGVIAATPIAYYFMNQWLQDFAYRVQLQWWVFLIAAILAILIAFLTVSVQSIRAALSNPIKALRSE